MSKHKGYVKVLFLVVAVVMGCVTANAIWGKWFKVHREMVKWFEAPKEIFEYDDTDTIAFGLTTGRSIPEIASSLSNITVFCQRNARGWDFGLKLERIEGFQRIASFDDQDDFMRIIERCRMERDEESDGSEFFRRDLPMYYIIFYYWTQNHVMIFPVKFDENLLGTISPWTKSKYAYSNKVLFRWLRELDQASVSLTHDRKSELLRLGDRPL